MMAAINNPTVTYGVSGANHNTMKPMNKIMELRTIALPGPSMVCCIVLVNGMFEDALLYILECAKNGGAASGEVLEHWGDILFKLNRIEEAIEKWKEAAQKDDAPDGIDEKIKNQSLHD